MQLTDTLRPPEKKFCCLRADSSVHPWETAYDLLLGMCVWGYNPTLEKYWSNAMNHCAEVMGSDLEIPAPANAVKAEDPEFRPWLSK